MSPDDLEKKPKRRYAKGCYLTVGELKKMIANIDDEEEVFFRPRSNMCGNIIGAEMVEHTVYGFFGKPIPCVIIDIRPHRKRSAE